MIESALKLRKQIKSNSSKVDETNTFPLENVELLKAHNFMSFLIPKRFGGQEGTLKEFVEISKIISSACLSTGVIWSMHCQQVAVLVNHASDEFKSEFLYKIAVNNYLIGSVTTEVGKGGHLLSVLSPLIYENDSVLLNRFAPIVTGGGYCDAFLITMKNSEDAHNTEVKLLYAERSQLEVSASAAWNTMGMRGTQSIALALKGKLPLKQIIHQQSDFQHIANHTMIPMGHIAWASCWLGALMEALKGTVKTYRDPKNRQQFDLSSDLFLEKLARVRLDVDTVFGFLNYVVEKYNENLTASSHKVRSPNFQILINNLKVLSSEVLFKAIHNLIELSGMKFGYTANEQNPLERIFRDIRSGSLMYHNNRLLVVNGKLSLIDKSFFNYTEQVDLCP